MRVRVCAALLLSAQLLLTACAGNDNVLNPAADQAAHTLGMWHLMLWVCGFMYALVLLYLAAALWRARRALSGPPITETQTTPAEKPLLNTLVGWTTLVVLGLCLLAVGSFYVDRRLALEPTSNPLKIKITGAQWWWKIEYEDPVAQSRVTTANELHLPVNRPTIIELAAQDVIHSFWIPNLAGKEDLIPGRTNYLTINPRKTGTYHGQCAEFCGLQHAKMSLDATVDDTSTFEAWREAESKPAQAPKTDAERRGQQLFLSNPCASCHQIVGTDAGGQSGPDLTHLSSRRTIAAGALPNTSEGLLRWLSNTQGVKPGNHMPQVSLSREELTDLVAYLRSLT